MLAHIRRTSRIPALLDVYARFLSTETPPEVPLTKPRRAMASDRQLVYQADKSVLENWKEAMHTMEEMMKEIDAKRPKQYIPDKFKEMKEYNDTNGKVIVAPMELVPVAKAPFMPSLTVQNLNGTEFDLKNLTGGKLTLLLTCFKNSGFDNHIPWKNHFNSVFGKNETIQILQLNIVEEWYWKAFHGMIRNGLKSKVDESHYDVTFTHFGRCNDVRTTLDLFNTFVGYVQLVDTKGRVRWSAAGDMTPEEAATLVRLSQKLLEDLNQKHKRQ
ncbi:hypothetical protein THRCLA_03466 [Thraustotheca clavata]|uniref:Mitochondrial ATPase complex subunit ATP10 n=1 Tax=Thraustotheca clavata TaxID=74557 RepID=A0A1W0A264_9STRA|nr:hypothetical protein THRCLA_03466 [Thraustotheca clavata]